MNSNIDWWSLSFKLEWGLQSWVSFHTDPTSSTGIKRGHQRYSVVLSRGMINEKHVTEKGSSGIKKNRVERMTEVERKFCPPYL
jgi:hypothetical protein